VFTLFKQPDKLGLLPNELKQKLISRISSQSPFFKTAQKLLDKSLSETRFEDHHRMMINTLLLQKVLNLEISQVGFFTQGYSLETDNVFNQLNIHQPVYGKVVNKNKLVNQLSISLQRAQDGLPTKETIENYKFPTRLQLKAQQLDSKKYLVERKDKNIMEKVVNVKLNEGLTLQKPLKSYIYENC
jgi:hypothetical protein